MLLEFLGWRKEINSGGLKNEIKKTLNSYNVILPGSAGKLLFEKIFCAFHLR